MTDAAIKAALDAAARKACWCGGECYGWRGLACELTGADCARTAAAVAAFLFSMASAGVSLAHMHDWHDLAARVQEAARDDR